MKLAKPFLRMFMVAVIAASASLSVPAMAGTQSSFKSSPPSSMGMSKRSISPPSAPSAMTKPSPAAPSVSAMGMDKRPLGATAATPTPAAAPAPSVMGMDKRPLGAPTATAPAASAMGMDKRPMGAAATVPTAQRSNFDQAANKQLSGQSLARYQADKARSSQPAQPVDTAALRNNPTYASARSSWHSTNDYYSARSRSYDVVLHQQPSTVIFVHQHIHPNYGIYDSLWLSMLLVHASDASYANWAYAHRYDPAYQQWRSDTMQLAEQNGELKAQVAALDAQVASMQSRGVAPQAANVLPEGIDQSVVIAPEAVVADAESNAFQAPDQAPVRSNHHFGLIIGLLIVGLLVTLVVYRRSIWQAILRSSAR